MSEEDAILFIECTRDDKKGAILAEMRSHYADGVGLAADLSGTLEVHFKDLTLTPTLTATPTPNPNPSPNPNPNPNPNPHPNQVHFKEENSAGSAVKREWFALTSDALVAPEAGVLVSPDRGGTFRPRPTGPKAPEGPKARPLLAPQPEP